MVLRILKSNRSVNYLLFPAFGILFWLKSLVFPQPVLYSDKSESLVFELIAGLTKQNIQLNSILAFLLILLMAFLVQLINNRYSFIRIRTMLPASLFIVITGGFTSLHTLLPVYFAAIFLLIAVYRSFDAFNHPAPYSAAFDTGFLLGFGSLFYFDFVIIFPAFFFGIGILSRSNNWRQFVLITAGFILPFIFAATYAVYTDQFTGFFMKLVGNFISDSNQISINLARIVFPGYLLVLTIFSSIKIIRQFDAKKVSTRKYFLVFFLIFLLSLSGYVAIPSISHEMLLITIIPLTFLISNFFVFFKSRLWSEVLFSILLLIVISMQFLN